MKRKKKRIVAIMAILVACCFMLNTTVFAQGILDTEETVRVDRIMIAEYMVKKTIPTVSEKVIVPYQDAFGAFSAKNTAIGFTLCLDENNRAMAVGAVQLGGTEVAFSASGDYVTGSKTRDYTVLAMLTGQMGDETITMTVSYDRGSMTSYVYLSVGKLGEYSAPIQLEFGECTENIERVNAEVIEGEKDSLIVGSRTNGELLGNGAMLNRSSGSNVINAEYRSTTYLTLGSWGKVAALSLYAPSVTRMGLNFKYCAKINLNDSNLLQYIKDNVESGATGVLTDDGTNDAIRVFSAEIEMYSSDAALEVMRGLPEAASENITLVVPWLDVTTGNINIKEIEVATASITYSEYPSGAPSRTNHTFYFGSLGKCISIDYGNLAPREVDQGIGVNNTMSYFGNRSSVVLHSITNIVAGYIGAGTRPGSRVVKTYALSTLSSSTFVEIE